MRPEVIRDLKLGSYGLRMVVQPSVQAAFEDVVGWWGIARMRQGSSAWHRTTLRHSSQPTTVHRLASCGLSFSNRRPISRADAQAGSASRRLGLRMRGATAADLDGLVGFLTGSLADFVERRFTSDKLRRLILANSLTASTADRIGPASMGLLFHLLTGGEDRQPGFQGHVIGGMGAITSAMRKSCEISA